MDLSDKGAPQVKITVGQKMIVGQKIDARR